jgi:Putative peptidoglycan binding domain/D-alanyl-D-alanine carboxypeptidase
MILEDIRVNEPDIHGRLGTAGMLCCRFVRGSRCAISNHSWGTAIDLTIDGVLDTPGDNRAQRGLLQIHSYFNNHGFYWGAAFPTEDAMHFEASDQLVREWQASGELGPVPQPTTHASLLEFGDRGADVLALQDLLRKVLAAADIARDGVFGTATRAAVIEFQARNGLAPDGVVGRKTMETLRSVAAR